MDTPDMYLQPKTKQNKSEELAKCHEKETWTDPNSANKSQSAVWYHMRPYHSFPIRFRQQNIFKTLTAK